MRYISLLLLLMVLPGFVLTQDSYHQSLLDQLETDFGITGGEWLFSPNENDILSDAWSYGDHPFNQLSTTDQPFSQKITVNIASDYDFPWGTAWGLSAASEVATDDVLLIVYWARMATNGSGRINGYYENNVTYEKEFIETFPLSNEWRQYFFPIKSRNDYAVGASQFGFHVGNMQQSIEFAGMNILNYKDKYNVEELPLQINNDIYGGFQADAPWRVEAAERIEQLRKAPLSITLKDSDGSIVTDAGVRIEMLQHEFAFGTAVVSCMFGDNNCQDDTYEEKLLNLDGEGHGFNWVAFENGLKWPYWEGGWPNSQFEKAKAIKWLSDRDMKIRGSSLLQPALWSMPNDIQLNIADVSYVENRIDAHLEEILQYPGINGVIQEWDVLDQVTWGGDLPNSLMGSPGYETGREIYDHVFKKAKQEDGFPKLYINDYVTLGQQNSKGGTYDRYQGYIQELLDAGAPVEGIGFQGHMGVYPTSIYQVEEILNDFSQKFNAKHKITEYDLDIEDGDELAANYMRDFLTYIFSHPSTDGFLLGGFWDGAHWKNNAPIFYEDWTLKPSGQAFIDLVFKEWWTNTFKITNSDGQANLNAFKGKYVIQINCDEIFRDTVTLDEAGLILEYPCDQILGIQEVNTTAIKLIPNPSQMGSSGTILQRADATPAILKIFNPLGKLVVSKNVAGRNLELEAPLLSGIHYIQIQDHKGISRVPWVVM